MLVRSALYIYLSSVTWSALSQLRPPVFSPRTHLPSLFVLFQVEAQTAAGRLDHRASGQQSSRHKLCEPWIPVSALSQRRVIILNLFNLSSAVTAPFSLSQLLRQSFTIPMKSTHNNYLSVLQVTSFPLKRVLKVNGVLGPRARA